MNFSDMMNAMFWATRETDRLCAGCFPDWLDSVQSEFVAGHKQFAETMAWLQDNRAAIEAAPELKLDFVKKDDEIKRLLAERDELLKAAPRLLAVAESAVSLWGFMASDLSLPTDERNAAYRKNKEARAALAACKTPDDLAEANACNAQARRDPRMKG